MLVYSSRPNVCRRIVVDKKSVDELSRIPLTLANRALWSGHVQSHMLVHTSFDSAQPFTILLKPVYPYCLNAFIVINMMTIELQIRGCP